MEKLKKYKEEVIFHIGLNIIFSVFITLSPYTHIPFGGLKGFLFYLVHFLVLQFTVFGCIYILSLIKKVFLILFPVIFLILSGISFWVYTQDISINSGIIQVILESNFDIAIDIINFHFLAYLFFGLIIVLFWILKFKKYRISSVKSPIFFLSLLSFLTFFLVEKYKFGTLKRKLPYSVYFATKEFFKTDKVSLKKVSQNVYSKAKDVNIVFVLGESVRSDHLAVNGYNKNTTPLLAKQSNLVSFTNVYTSLTYTAISLPQILTDKSLVHTTTNEFTSVYSVLNSSGFNTIWIGNQSLEKSYEEIVKTNNSVKIIDEFHSVLSFKKLKDLELLASFNLKNKNTITTLHMIGSHWYYNSRYDKSFEKFTPVTTSKHVGSSTKNQLINSYNNTILYLDFFLNKLIEDIKKSDQKTVVIYLSDHGETLGEEGKWFHAQDHKSSKNPAMLVWSSDSYLEENPNFIKNLTSKRNDSISTDFLFHSILHLAKVKNFDYNLDLSIFKQ